MARPFGPAWPARLASLLLLLALAACQATPGLGVADLARLPQDTAFYQARQAQPPWTLDPAYQADLKQKFLEQWLAPWQQAAPRQDVAAVRQGFLDFWDDLGYGENRQPHTRAWLEGLLALAGLDDYPNQGWPGLTLGPTDLRGLPTSHPHVDGFAHPGQGLAFDNLQQSLLPPGTPVYVVHASRDGAWLLVDSSQGTWWVRAQLVGRVDAQAMAAWRRGPWAALVQDGVTLRDGQGWFLGQAGVGALFPLAGQDAQGLTVLAPAGVEGWARPRPARLAPGQAAPWPLPLGSAGLAAQAQVLLGQPYGWGGSFGNRDCSALLKDLFTPFGLWLPRNSSQQASQGGQVLDLKGLSPAQRERLILARGVPYLTLLHRPGHIVLYIGEYQGRALVLHDIWGLKTQDWAGREGRRVIGGSVITTLEPGRELADLARPEGILLNRLDSLTLLAPPERLRTQAPPAP